MFDNAADAARPWSESEEGTPGLMYLTITAGFRPIRACSNDLVVERTEKTVDKLHATAPIYRNPHAIRADPLSL
jgi:hypothetical protein